MWKAARRAFMGRLGAWQYVCALLGVLAVACAWTYVDTPASTGGLWDLRLRSLGAMVALLSAAEFAYDQNPNNPGDLSWRWPTFKEAFAIGNLLAALAALLSILFLPRS